MQSLTGRKTKRVVNGVSDRATSRKIRILRSSKSRRRSNEVQDLIDRILRIGPVVPSEERARIARRPTLERIECLRVRPTRVESCIGIPGNAPGIESEHIIDRVSQPRREEIVEKWNRGNLACIQSLLALLFEHRASLVPSHAALRIADIVKSS